MEHWQGSGGLTAQGAGWRGSAVAFQAQQNVVPHTPLSCGEDGNQSGLEDRASVPVSLHGSFGSGFPESSSATSLPSGLDYWV